MNWYQAYLIGFQEGYLKALEQQFLSEQEAQASVQPVMAKRCGRPKGSHDRKPRKKGRWK